MQSVNKVVVAGNLGRDPQVGATRKGMLVAKFSVAANTTQPDGSTRTVWFPCLALKDQAEFVKRSLSQGDPVYLEGSLETYQYAPAGSKLKVPAFRIMVDRISRAGSPKPARTATSGAPMSFDFRQEQRP